MVGTLDLSGATMRVSLVPRRYYDRPAPNVDGSGRRWVTPDDYRPLWRPELLVNPPDWCRDESIRPLAAAEDETPPLWAELTRLTTERTNERADDPTTVTLTRAHPALAGPLPGQGIAA